MENGYCVNPALDSSELDGGDGGLPGGEEEERVEEEPTQTVLSLVLDPRVTSANPCKKAKLSRW